MFFSVYLFYKNITTHTKHTINRREFPEFISTAHKTKTIPPQPTFHKETKHQTKTPNPHKQRTQTQRKTPPQTSHQTKNQHQINHTRQRPPKNIINTTATPQTSLPKNIEQPPKPLVRKTSVLHTQQNPTLAKSKQSKLAAKTPPHQTN